MKLERWALIAEIVSGICVVTTLIFLIVGIRANTEVVRTAAYGENIDWLNEFLLTITTNDTLSEQLLIPWLTDAETARPTSSGP